MPTISREYTATSDNYDKGGNSPRYIVVHHTGGGGSAEDVAHWKANDWNPEHPGSFHFVLDGGGTIFQMMELTDTAWAVGAWKGCVQYIGNDESISIEVCANGTPFTVDEVAELRWLVRMLMERFGIPAGRVVRHWDCMSGHKDCPRWYTPEGGGGNAAWEALRDTITREELQVDVWNQEIATKEGNQPAWSCLSWAWAYAKDMQPKVSDTRNRVISLETKVTELRNRVIALETAQKEQTTLMKNMQKALNTIVKKLA